MYVYLVPVGLAEEHDVAASYAADFLCLLALAAPTTPATAREDYPARTVTIVNPFAPGGGTDLLARMVAQKLEQRLGKSFVVENKTGAGSIIAAVAVQKSAPDGYTLLMAPTPTMAVNVSLYKSLPYEPLTDFVPLGAARADAVRADRQSDLPVKSVPELIAYAKANPGKLSFASVGPGRAASSLHGDVQEHDRHQGVACALSRQPAGAERRDRRPRADDVLRSRPGDRRAAGRHGAPARHVVDVPRRRLRRHPAARRSRRAGLRRGRLADAGRAGQDAAADRRPAQSRADRHPGAAGDQGADPQVRIRAGRQPLGRGPARTS